MPSDIATPIIGFIGIIIGAIIGSWCTYKYALKLVNIQTVNADRMTEIQRRNDAGIKFRLAFYDELAILSDWNNDVNPDDVLLAAFQKHISAVLEFAHFLSETDRDKFKADWNKHYQNEHISHKYYPDFSKYAIRGIDINKRKEIRATVIKNIEHLISYANHA